MVILLTRKVFDNTVLGMRENLQKGEERLDTSFVIDVIKNKGLQ